MKSEIIAQLGQMDILLPSLIAESLSANDRVKARLSVHAALRWKVQAEDSGATRCVSDSHRRALPVIFLIARAMTAAREST